MRTASGDRGVRYGAMVLLHSDRRRPATAWRRATCVPARARAEIGTSGLSAARPRAGSREGCPRCRQRVPVGSGGRRPAPRARRRAARAPERLLQRRPRVGKREAMGPLERDRLEQLFEALYERAVALEGRPSLSLDDWLRSRGALAHPPRARALRRGSHRRSAPPRRAAPLALLPHAAGRRASDQRRRYVRALRGPRLPHQGQKRKKPCETGPRQRAQRSGRAGWDQGRPGLRLHTGQ